MWKKKPPAPPAEFIEVHGKVARFGVIPFNYVFQGFRVVLEGGDTPYILGVCGVNGRRALVELTQVGDEVSFTVEKGYLNGTNFVNHSFAPGLKQYVC